MNRIVICGSGKLREEIFLAGRLLNDAGLQVMVPPLHRIEELVAGRPAECRELAWKGATFAHFNRIDKSDVVFIVNPNGYIGPSTTLELGYAVARHAYIVAMMPDEAELARTVLLDCVLGTADVERACKELAGMLKGPVIAGR
jgi:nucleoside 2-deoxyribosyltransferase